MKMIYYISIKTLMNAKENSTLVAMETHVFFGAIFLIFERNCLKYFTFIIGTILLNKHH